MKLTKAALQRLSLPVGKSESIVFDDDLPGFGLRMRAGGKRTWIAQYRVGTKQRRLTLGTAEAVDPEEARRRARNALAQVHLGKDPQAERAAARAQAAVTLKSVAGNYLERYAAPRLKPSTFAEVDRYLRRHWSPLGHLSVQRITRADVAARLAAIATQNGGYAANRARAALSSLFGWAIAEGLVDLNPVVGTRMPVVEVARNRVLSDAELSTVWQHAGGGDFGAILKLLILTGQRCDEVGGMSWSEIDHIGALWHIPAPRTKNRRSHDVPLSTAALALINERAKREEVDFVFGARGTQFSGWSKAKARLDARIAEHHGASLSPWRLHDLRRTAATRMADLGVLPHIIEATLNHISGHKAGVAGVYNVASYLSEKRVALDQWAERVCHLVGHRNE